MKSASFEARHFFIIFNTDGIGRPFNIFINSFES